MELIVTVALIAIISLLVVPKVITVISESKERAYNTAIDTIEEAAKSYTYLNTNVVNSGISSNGYYDVTILVLQQNKLLDTDLINPQTDASFSTQGVVRITKTGNIYNYVYQGG